MVPSGLIRDSIDREIIAIVNEEIDKAPHYNSGDIETIEAIEDWGFGEGFNAGCVIKYITRYNHKGTPVKDLKKAVYYLNRLLKLVEKRES